MRTCRLAFAALCCAGCGTLIALSDEERYPNQIYAGTRVSWNGHSTQLDAPFSFVADTLLLPYTIPRTIHNAPNIPAPVVRDAWSKPVAGLAGRIRAASESIGPAEAFELTLEFHNESRGPLAIQADNPFAITIRLRGEDGKPVAPTLSRSDVTSTPRWIVLPPDGYASFPVSGKSGDAAKGAQLDTGTGAWMLSGGKYRLDSGYSSDPFGEFPGNPSNAAPWKGALALPPIELEIREKPERREPSIDPSGVIHRPFP